MIKGYHQVIHKMYAMRLISKSGAVCHLLKILCISCYCTDPGLQLFGTTQQFVVVSGLAAI